MRMLNDSELTMQLSRISADTLHAKLTANSKSPASFSMD